jgi:hypothetical protein
LNRLAVGVFDFSARGRVEQRLEEIGIPRNAVIFEDAFIPVPDKTLRDNFRPTEGGIIIEFLKTDTVRQCTLGFNAEWNGAKVFVTNSHCSRVYLGPDSTEYYQNDWGSLADFVGKEVNDPKYFTGGACPSGYRCRYSDA